MTIPKSERLHICLFGRTNVGKSSIINFISGQNVSIVSEINGTTTDIVEKAMEITPLGPIVLIDTAGINDESVLGEKRKEKTEKILQKCDVACLIVEPNVWTESEIKLVENFKKNNIKFIIVINKIDLQNPTVEFENRIKEICNNNLLSVSIINSQRDEFINNLKQIINKEFSNDETAQTLLQDLVKSGDVCLFVTPIDSGAPTGRLIMPQVQAIRAALDANVISLIVQPAEYQTAMSSLVAPPKIVICDSQVVKEIIENSDASQLITTFSILFARLKGDFEIEAKSAYALATLQKDDKILIAEACSHHSQKDDIAKVKIPKLLEKYYDFVPNIEFSNGRDFPNDLENYKLIIHCGACMLTKTEKINRIKQATSKNVPITNFGMTISFLNGYIDRALAPFRT